MQNSPKPASAPSDNEKDRLRQKLLRLILKSEAERRVPPQAKNRIEL
jgi:hypothetical protein